MTSKAATLSEPCEKLRILVVSPGAGIRAEVAAGLRGAGAIVQESEHASDALHQLEIAAKAGAPLDAVVVDEDLSGIDAELFASLVREDTRMSSLPLVLLRGRVNLDFSPLASAGYVGQLVRPVDSASIKRLLRALPRRLTSPSSAAVVGNAETFSGAAAKVSILLVEDNYINREVARELIEDLGYECDHAEDGQEALDAVQKRRYDLILMDCQMPGMDGYESTRRIRAWEEANGGNGGLPIVAVTAHAMKGDRERCLACGMNDYMTKPVESRRLAAMIARWLPISKPRSADTSVPKGAPCR